MSQFNGTVVFTKIAALGIGACLVCTIYGCAAHDSSAAIAGIAGLIIAPFILRFLCGQIVQAEEREDDDD